MLRQLRRLGLVLGAFVALSGAAGATGLPIVAGDRVHFPGDSITAFGWFSQAGSLVDQVNATWATPPMARIAARATGGRAVATGGMAVGQLVQPTQRAISVTSSGVVGNKASDIAADVTNRIIVFNPTVVILDVVINDAIQGTNATAFQASIDSIVSQTQTALPGVKIMLVSALCYGEQYLAGPAWGANSSDGFILADDAALQAVAVKYNQYYADIRTPLLAYEAVHNTPQPGAVFGIVTGDNTHPISPTGQVLMGTWAFAGVSVAP